MSALPSSKDRKRTYLACKLCRKRKIKCVTKGEDTPCKRCSERSFQCEYMPVCVEYEGQLLGHSEGEGHASTPAYSGLNSSGRTPSHGTGFRGAPPIHGAAGWTPYPQQGAFSPVPSHSLVGTSSYQQYAQGPPPASAVYAQTTPVYAPRQQPVPAQPSSQYDQYFSHFGLPPMYATK
ncbi:hypothetical protein C8R43DRAFT_1190285 [Mycena crocata]|nr:hypothetical protein C8R43DRAFT_1190285 [Mycena crocata]